MDDSQADVIRFLSAPVSHGGHPVERIDTHAAIVFLAGDLALKLKRAVRFDYLDFSTVDRRRDFCLAEASLNERTAPALASRVLPVTRGRDGRLALEGDGTPVEWVIAMRRFDQGALFDRLAAGGRLALGQVEQLAAEIAAFHATAERRTDHGGAAGMRWVIEGNAAGLAEFGRGLLAEAACREVIDESVRALDRSAARLDARRAEGYVRRCHGDLHLGNIVWLDGRPTLFDAVEFNDEIACIDVFYDLAFLLMDLWRSHLVRHANVLLNEYVQRTGDMEGLRLLPLFMACRAAVRAKTSVTAAQVQPDAAHREEARARAAEYLELAGRFLRPPSAVLVAIGGFSGSGKSTLAAKLAPEVGAAPGALVLRSDAIRKRLAGVRPLDRLAPEHYGASTSAQVYEELRAKAADALRAGHSVIVDAVCARAEDRAALEATAAAARVPFTGFWLDAPAATLTERVVSREPDVSDADASVVAGQLARGAGPLTWVRVDAARDPDAIMADVEARLRAMGAKDSGRSSGD